MPGFLRWLFGRSKTEPAQLPQTQLPGDGTTFPLAVVGESFHQGQLERIAGDRREEGVQQFVTAHLMLEDENPYDRNAVKVLVGGLTVGHLARPDAVAYRQYLQAHGLRRVIGVCNGQIRGGWDRGGGDRGHFGIWLDFTLYGSPPQYGG